MDTFEEYGVGTKAADPARNSVQARASGKPSSQYAASDVDNAGQFLFVRLAQRADALTPFSYFPGLRDRQLRQFWKTESILSGGIYAFNSRIRTLDHEVQSDSQRKKKATQDILNESDYEGGLDETAGRLAMDILTQDNGGFLEIWSSGGSSTPLTALNKIYGIAHIDAGQCIRTFDREFPVVYIDPIDNKRRKLHKSKVIMFSSMTQPDELARGIGYCPVSRALSWIQYIRNVQTFKDEKVTGRFNRAIGYGSGFTREILKNALSANDMDSAAKGYVMYKDIPFILPPGQGLGQMELKLLDLASLPDGFDFHDELTLYVYILALCFGTDARDFWPATASGATKADATVQNMKSRGKGIGDLIQMIERAINRRICPEGVEFRYDFADDEQDFQKAQQDEIRGRTIMNFTTGGVITKREARAQAVIAKVLDPAGLFEEELITDTVEPASDGDDATTNPKDKPGQEGLPADDKKPQPTAVQPQRAAASKALQATRLDFELAMEDLLSGAQQKSFERPAFTRTLRTLIKSYGAQAFKDGLEQGGVSDLVLDGDDAATYALIVAEQTGYIAGLADNVYAEDADLSVGFITSTPSMWFNKSIYPFFSAGVLSADRNGLYEWVLGGTAKHCDSCAKLAGQKHRMKHWAEKNLLPKAETLDCGGFECHCELVKTTGKAEGRFL